MHPWMLDDSHRPHGTVETICAEPTRIVPIERRHRCAQQPLAKHFRRKCICVSPAMVVCGGGRTRLELDTHAELVLELDQAAELTELLSILITVQCGEHPGKVAL
jgi:hypothetical protein